MSGHHMALAGAWASWTIVLAAAGAAAEQGGADPRAQARALREAAGVQGGLLVHLGCGDGRLTAAFRGDARFVVHGLERDPDQLARARQAVRARNLYGPVSLGLLRGRRLPYADNVVNLAVVSEPEDLPSWAELTRVLAPGGAALVRGEPPAPPPALRRAPCGLSGWTKWLKPRPDDVDEWTHYLHGPDNNAVAADRRAGPSRSFQWIAEPKFSRSHDHLASVAAVVSSGGRVFSIVDMGPVAFAAASPRWRLVARDAYSGVRLWERNIGRWEYHLRDFRSGPADLARRLVAVGDRVYVTLNYGDPVSQLDAATGQTRKVYAGTEGAREIVAADGVLYVVSGDPDPDWRRKAETAKRIVSQEDYVPPFETYTPPATNLRIAAVRADTGAIVWRKADADTQWLMPCTLAVAEGRACFQNPEAVVCLDAASGKVLWKTPRPIQRKRLGWSTPTLVIRDGVVLSADRNAVDREGELLWMPSGGYHEYIRADNVDGRLIALDAATGRPLWSCPVHEGFNAPVDVLVIDGLVWTGRIAEGRDPGFTEARDLKTGQVVRRRPPDQTFVRGGGHARCHRTRATTRYIVMGRRGVEWVDVRTGGLVAHRYVRGSCQYGFMPANGLLYVPPHSCACSVNDLLKCGFIALAPGGPEEPTEAEAPPQLERGPAYGDRDRPPAGPAPGEWPMHRHDPSRSGATPARVASELQPAWQAALGGKLTPPVAAEGCVLAARTDAHQVVALDAATGRRRWTFTAEGRIDSPPTVAGGRALFGSADGYVYCLRLQDGQLAWRFRAAPRERRFVVREQLESAWPVSGSVLVADGAAYFVAGRTSYLDGGMRIVKLDAATGEVLRDVRLAVPDDQRDRGVASGGYLPDILSAQNGDLFLRHARFDLELNRRPDTVPHLWSSVGLLDDTWWHRTYWQYGVSMASGWGGWPRAGRQVPAGRLLVTDGRRIFGYGRNQYDIPGAHPGIDARGVWGPIAEGLGRWTYYRLFGRPLEAPNRGAGADEPRTAGWSQRIPILVQGMVLAGDTLFVAGPEDPLRTIPRAPSDVDPLAQAWNSREGGRWAAVAADDGRVLAHAALESPPVFDGLIAAWGRLYASTRAGSIVCLAPRR